MRGFGVTDKGNIRKENQDGFLFKIFPERSLAVFAVCDGMGGARGGQLASQLGLETFFSYVLSGLEHDSREMAPEEILRQAASCANSKIYSRSMSERESRGMGTTLVAAIIKEDNATIVNIGDSRAYFICGESIQRITRDHSLVEELVTSGRLTREQARVHPKKNLITRALGVDREVLCDIYTKQIDKGDILMLCTDGLSNLFSDDEMLRAAGEISSPEEICNRLLKAALEKGAPDNVTIAVFEG